jgi:hypothetical protein
MVVQLKDLFAPYNLLEKLIAFVKDDNTNLNTFTMAFTSIISYVLILLPQAYVVNYYGHAMSKCCQYAINDLKNVWWHERGFN